MREVIKNFINQIRKSDDKIDASKCLASKFQRASDEIDAQRISKLMDKVSLRALKMALIHSENGKLALSDFNENAVRLCEGLIVDRVKSKFKTSIETGQFMTLSKHDMIGCKVIVTGSEINKLSKEVMNESEPENGFTIIKT